ncbi:hypothetical protein AGABI1DRAFT_59755 [Agaricus bisporus var. burnettii JB137-S8]|uniref:BRO1 domain-containing protein n=1 Tax=Agaricus bisporus var. burnettii (strain JB137-S8 / ATCC MYA-4627 / FGSC 10392) TaxID=597362 RepID=K5WTI2_AGABU|nr:uncharacterized protein AGABI1DRAFT_59755 [Agaricus bisporus var. burnettii JB137-S8]EKM78721.1 hypothetical protein AGABI1DRAFT_59755 [Agaricus bisporus var. burnettii JB137-S8]
MSNLLDFPPKKTYDLDLETPIQDFISAHGGGHPDEFKYDIKQWHSLRNNAVATVVHVDQIDVLSLYHAQLTSILSKLPSDIPLEISYAPAFNPRKLPVTLNNLTFERAAILFNLASLYSQLGASTDRSNTDGIKNAVARYQYAAGTLSYLNTVLPSLSKGIDEEEQPLDLTSPFVLGLKNLMLAQAQECSWQLAKINHYKNSLIAKIATRVASLYALSLQEFRNANPSVKHILPSDWIPHIEAKYHHFTAVAAFRKSLDETENSRYGYEISRLSKAQEEAKKAYDIGRRGKITASVLEDIKSLLDTVQKDLARAQRDNDLIYHHDVPAAAALPIIQETNLTDSTIPPALRDPNTALKQMQPLFDGLVGWGAREAMNIYNDRKQTLVRERVVEAAQELQFQADEQLRSMNLPAALEALERPIGLPPSLLRKAEEVQLENGLSRVTASIEDVRRLAQNNQAILDGAMDILDSEASEDEAARNEIPLNRLPSHEANVELIEKERRYRRILADAGESDETIRQKWDDWEESIAQLTWNEADLEASVPSSTVGSSSNFQSLQTRNHARSLRARLEQLDALHHDRDQLVNQARNLEAADDIQPRVLKVASGFERLTEIRADMFEDILDEELAKYDRFINVMGDLQQREESLLGDIRVINEQFLESRRDDPSVKDREHALQSLDLAYFKYREICRNLDEGFKFYNDLAGILTQFREVCKVWSLQRRRELHDMQAHISFEKLSLNDDGRVQQDLPSSEARTRSDAPGTQLSGSRFAHLSSRAPPSLESQEWEFEDMNLPPGPGK